jgi:hypothetical protein
VRNKWIRKAAKAQPATYTWEAIGMQLYHRSMLLKPLRIVVNGR